MAQPDETVPVCRTEAETIAYLTGQLPADRQAGVEEHIFDCDSCRQLMAHTARNLSEPVRPVEISPAIYESTLATALKLPEQLAESGGQGGTGRSRYGWLAMAAAVIIMVLAGLIGTAVWRQRADTDAQIERGLIAFRDATRVQRASQFRITGSEHAPYQFRGNGAAEGDKLDIARALAITAVKERPTPAARHLLGRVLTASGDYDRALAEFSLAVQERPRDSALLTDLGVARAMKGDLSAALEALNSALANDAQQREALFNRALVHQALNRADAARADWQRYLALDNDSAWAQEARNNLAELKE